MSASTVREYFELLEQHYYSRHRARRARSPVPFYEWMDAFRETQHMVANAIAAAYAEMPNDVQRQLPSAFGAILRYVLNMVTLPVIRKYLAEHKGIESPEEVARIIKAVYDQLVSNEELLSKYLRDALERILGKANEDILREYLKWFKTFMTEYFAKVWDKVALQHLRRLKEKLEKLSG